MANKTSQHILSTSTNLLGFCLFIITSLHITNRTNGTLIDELTSVVVMLLSVSSILSFISIKTINSRREEILENIADYCFIVALIGVFSVVAYISINSWNK